MDFQNNLLLFNKNRFPDFFYSLFLEIKLKLLTTIFDRFIRVWIVATAAQKFAQWFTYAAKNSACYLDAQSLNCQISHC